MRHSKVLFVLFVVSGLQTASAQEGVDRDSQLWVATVFQGMASEYLRGFLEIQPRLDTGMSDLNLVIVRPALSYQFMPKLWAWVGVGRFEGVGSDQIDESRIWQQISYENTQEPLKLVIRSRFEERFIKKTSGTGLRWRNMIRGVVPIEDGTFVSAVMQNEIFWNLNDVTSGPQSGFDQNRFFVGPNLRFTPKINADIGYLNRYVKRTSGRDRQDHVVAVTVNFNF